MKTFRSAGRCLLLAAVAATVAGCAGPRHGMSGNVPAQAAAHGGAGQTHGHGHGGMMSMPSASATLAPGAGQAVRGMVVFHDMGGHMMVHARVSGLKANAQHGFHVHEKGDCTAADFTSAGGHFNPGNQPHGQSGSAAHHAGDLPNLRADANGNAELRLMLHGLSMGGGAANDVVGRAVVVHANPDDYSSQPAGNSGPRIACGVIARQP